MLISSQRYLDQEIVDAKIAANDFVVSVSPEFALNGVATRVVLDGHHSYAAAVQTGNEPVLEEVDSCSEVATVLRDHGVDALLEVTYQEDSWYDVADGVIVL